MKQSGVGGGCQSSWQGRGQRAREHRSRQRTMLEVPAPMTSSIHVAGLTWSRIGMVFGIACTAHKAQHTTKPREERHVHPTRDVKKIEGGGGKMSINSGAYKHTKKVL